MDTGRVGIVNILDKGCLIWSRQTGGRPEERFINAVKEDMQRVAVIF